MKTGKEMFINVSAGSTRIALTDNEKLVELYVELPDHQRTVGNIYKGKVQNVIPGMQAAFIDIGHDVNAFLPFSEIGSPESIGNLSFNDDDDDNVNHKKNKKISLSKNKDLSKNLVVGDEILVQITKEAFSGKGPRVTTDISIPGSLMVLVPNVEYIGISRKIGDKYEKRRLRRLAKEIKPKNYGLIIRTISEGKDQTLLTTDYNRIWKKWEELQSKSKNKQAPTLVYRDFTTSVQVIRDLFTPDIKKLVVDDKKLLKRITSYFKEVSPEKIEKIELKKGKSFIFDENKIEEQIDKSLKRKVWMKSGAHLVIEHTEAMVVIDVNSGRYIGKKDHEQNSLKINLEAAKEVAHQLRLRDIGGLIVIDFIDLQEQENRKRVFEELKKALKTDRAKVSLTEFSTFGLLEMTRQRVRLNLLHTISEDCPTCNGRGRIALKDTTLTSIENWLKRFRYKAKDRRLIIYLHPQMLEYIKKTKSKVISSFMWKNWMLLDLRVDQEINLDQFRIFSKKRNKDVTLEV
tara:strand:+ start:9466 stop:11016 length:1551 start_codon:yes stop_codon:yes gene_type:complete